MAIYRPADISAINTAISAGTYTAGDTVIIPSGTHTTAITFTPDDVNGSLGNPIIFDGQSQAVIDMSADATNSHAIEIDGCDYIHFKNLDLKGSGGHAAFRVQTTTGTAVGIEAYSVNILSNYGASDAGANHDGFSSDGSAELTIYDCKITGCRPDPQSAGSHQALASHGTGFIKMYRGSISDSNFATAPADTSLTELHNVTVGTCYTDAYGVAGNAAATVKVIDCTTSIDNGGGIMGLGSNTTASRVEIKGGSISVTSSDNQAIRGTGYIENCTITINATTFRITLSTATDTGILHLYNNTINCLQTQNAGYFFRADYDGIIIARGNTTKGQDSVSSTLFYWGGTATDTTGEITGNVFYNFTNATRGIWLATSSTAAPNICNNTFYNGTNAIDCDGTGAPIIYNNIFHTVTNPIVDAGSATHDYNDYYNSGSVEAGDGGNSITTDPLLVDPAGADFDLQTTDGGYASDSPCKDTGTQWFNGRSLSGHNGIPIPTLTASIGSWADPYDSFRPEVL